VHAWRAFFVAGAVGCSLAVSVDGLTGGDGGSHASDGAPGDGDAGARDAEDAGEAAEASRPGASPCAAVHDLCDDFDHGTVGAIPPWDGMVTVGGSLTLDTSTFRSPPASLVARVAATGADAGDAVPKAYLTRRFDGGARMVHCAFDARFDQDPPTEWQAFVLSTEPQSPSPLSGYFLAWAGPTPGVAASSIDEAHFERDGGGGGTFYPAYGVPGTDWFHAEIDVDLDADAGAAEMDIDDASVFTHRLTPPTKTSGQSLEIGITMSFRFGAAPVWSIHFDNIACDRTR
jgi:hypothetical protein